MATLATNAIQAINKENLPPAKRGRSMSAHGQGSVLFSLGGSFEEEGTGFVEKAAASDPFATSQSPPKQTPSPIRPYRISTGTRFVPIKATTIRKGLFTQNPTQPQPKDMFGDLSHLHNIIAEPAALSHTMTATKFSPILPPTDVGSVTASPSSRGDDLCKNCTHPVLRPLPPKGRIISRNR